MSADLSGRTSAGAPDRGGAEWLQRVAAAVASREDVFLLRYARLRCQWIQRSLTEFEARSALAALVQAAAPGVERSRGG